MDLRKSTKIFLSLCCTHRKVYECGINMRKYYGAINKFVPYKLVDISALGSSDSQSLIWCSYSCILVK